MPDRVYKNFIDYNGEKNLRHPPINTLLRWKSKVESVRNVGEVVFVLFDEDFRKKYSAREAALAKDLVEVFKYYLGQDKKFDIERKSTKFGAGLKITRIK